MGSKLSKYAIITMLLQCLPMGTLNRRGANVVGSIKRRCGSFPSLSWFPGNEAHAFQARHNFPGLVLGQAQALCHLFFGLWRFIQFEQIQNVEVLDP